MHKFVSSYIITCFCTIKRWNWFAVKSLYVHLKLASTVNSEYVMDCIIVTKQTVKSMGSI